MLNDPENLQTVDSDSATGILEPAAVGASSASAPDSTRSRADSLGDVPPLPHVLWHPLRATAWTIRTLFGIVTLVLLSAIVAAIPIVNFLAIGYLRDVEGRVARTGRVRFAFPMLDMAPTIGAIALGV